MKNQDIFEVFNHLKTLFGGNSAPLARNMQPLKSEKREISQNPSIAEREKRLQEFHLKHDALSRKITASHTQTNNPEGSVIFLRTRKESTENKSSNPHTLAGKERTENKPSHPQPLPLQDKTPIAENTPLFPPSFP